MIKELGELNEKFYELYGRLYENGELLTPKQAAFQISGLTEEELAFYDALTKPQAIKDFYENDELIAITKELTETLRKNKTIDWTKRESAYNPSKIYP